MTTIKVRGGTAAQWASANPVLAAREPGVETDTGVYKVGDGSTAWASLSSVLYSTYAQRTLRGSRAVWLGDSITQAGDLATGYAVSIPTLVGLVSQQKILRVGNAGKSGDTTAQALARFDTDVTPLAPNIVPICLGRNDDITQTFAARQATYNAILTKCFTIAALPVICTIPPVTAFNSQRPTEDWNAWLRRRAHEVGAPLVDYWRTAVDPATGTYLSAYGSGDGVHPGAAGYLLLANHFWSVMQSLVGQWGPTRGGFDASVDTFNRNSCFLGGTGGSGGAPDYWIVSANVSSGTSVISIDSSDANIKGNQVKFAHTSVVGVKQITFNQNVVSQTITSSPAANATTFTCASHPGTNGQVWIGSGATRESKRVTSVSGSGGNFTVTVNEGLRYSHTSGEALLSGGNVGDTIEFSGNITTDGNVSVSCGLTFVGPSTSWSAAQAISVAVTRGVFWGTTTIPSACTQIQINVNAGAGTGNAYVGEIVCRNITQEY